MVSYSSPLYFPYGHPLIASLNECSAANKISAKAVASVTKIGYEAFTTWYAYFPIFICCPQFPAKPFVLKRSERC